MGTGKAYNQIQMNCLSTVTVHIVSIYLFIYLIVYLYICILIYLLILLLKDLCLL